MATAAIIDRIRKVAGTSRPVGSEHSAAQNELSNLAVDLADAISAITGDELHAMWVEAMEQEGDRGGDWTALSGEERTAWGTVAEWLAVR